MKLSIGIVGLPNVGKSTLFKLLTKQEVHIANYPFATIDPNVGVVPVPDERLEKLAAMSKSKKVVPAVVEFYDIAGLVKGANQGEGLGNQFLSHIKETQAIILVLRLFENSDIIHVEQTVNPVRDLGIITTELILKDLDTVEKRLQKAESEAKSGLKDAIMECEALRSIKQNLEKGIMLSSLDDSYSNVLENIRIRELRLLTAKKQICLLNGTEDQVTKELEEAIKNLGAHYVCMDLAGESDLTPLITKAYETLGLISFLTTGEDETRAWTIERGTKAPQAAGVIHSDFEEKFIRAEVVPYTKLVEAGSWNGAKQKGWVRIEGKDCVVQDGDIIVIRHG